MEDSQVVNSVVSGIEKVAQAIAATSPANREQALDAAARSYERVAQELGYDQSAAKQFASVVMDQLRNETQRLTGHRHLIALHDELVALEASATEAQESETITSDISA